MSRIARLMAMGALGKTRLQRLLDLFTGDGGKVGIERVGTSYWLYSPIQDGRYQGTILTPFTVGGKSDIGIAGMSDRIPFASIKDNNSTYATKTGTWSNDAVEALAYGGTYSFCATAGGYITFTTPANVKRVGIRCVNITNAGIVLVSIDGDNTRANQLSTAQQLVDAGTIDATCLVANGGTLNPTDRVINQYFNGTNYDKRVQLANDLDAGVHTIVLSYTGYKQAASSAARLYITGISYNDSTQTVATAGIFMETMQAVGGTGSVYEPVQVIIPTGGSTGTYVGNGHGYSVLNSTVITIDGVEVTPADGSITAGDIITFTRNSSLYHPDIDAGATEIGVSITTYYPTSRNGLRVATQTTWSLGGTATTYYPGMFPVGIFMDKAANIELPLQSGTLAADDNTKVLNKKSPAAYVFDSDGYYAAVLYTPDMELNVKNYRENTSTLAHCWIEDTTGGSRNKIYQARLSNAVGVAYAIGEVWNSDMQWRIFRRPNTLMLPL